MSLWATRKKFTYLSLVFLFILIVIVLPIYFFTKKEPTCFDGRKNQSERGVDCGGECQRLCPADESQPIILWTRAFKVADDLYSAVAKVENPNIDAEAKNVQYALKLYDSNNVLVAEKIGSADIPPYRSFYVFEGGIFVGDRIPARSALEFKSNLDWKKSSDRSNDMRILGSIVDSEPKPRVNAIIKNESFEVQKNVAVTVVIFDTSNKAIAASKTYIDSLDRNTEEEIVFTWLLPFEKAVGRTEFYIEKK